MEFPSKLVHNFCSVTIGNLFLTAVVFCLSINQLHTQTPDKRKTIRDVKVYNSGIFDSSEINQNFFSGLINSLHTKTKTSVIINELLFTKGDKYSDEVLYETERNLRALPYLGEIDIYSDSIEEDSVSVIVRTRDKWSKNLGIKAGLNNKVYNYGLSLSEDNFLGFGKSLSIIYDYKSNEYPQNSYQFIYYDRRFFGSKWSVKYQKKYLPYLNIQTLLINRAYYSDSTDWSFLVYGSGANETRIFYRDGEIFERYDLKQYIFQSYYSFAIKENLIYRLTFGSNNVITNYNEPSVEKIKKTVDNSNVIFFSLSILDRRFIKTSRINNLGRTEDVPLGYQLTSGSGKELIKRNNSRLDYRFMNSFQYSQFIDNIFYFAVLNTTNADLMSGEIKNISIETQVNSFLKLSDNNIFGLVLFNKLNSHSLDYIEETLGGNNGLLGYKENFFTARNIFYFNYEYRFIPDLRFWIFSFAGFSFFNIGKAYNNYTEFMNDSFYKCIGLGIHIENEIMKGNDLISVAISYNFYQENEFGVYASTKVSLDFIQRFEFKPF